MKTLIYAFAFLFSTSAFGQLNTTAQQVQKTSPGVYNGIRILSLFIHDGNNYKVSQEINKQCEAWVFIVNNYDFDYTDDLTRKMYEWCADQNEWAVIKRRLDYGQGDVMDLFSLPINWWLVKADLFY